MVNRDSTFITNDGHIINNGVPIMQLPLFAKRVAFETIFRQAANDPLRFYNAITQDISGVRLCLNGEYAIVSCESIPRWFIPMMTSTTPILMEGPNLIIYTRSFIWTFKDNQLLWKVPALPHAIHEWYNPLLPWIPVLIPNKYTLFQPKGNAIMEHRRERGMNTVWLRVINPRFQLLRLWQNNLVIRDSISDNKFIYMLGSKLIYRIPTDVKKFLIVPSNTFIPIIRLRNCDTGEIISLMTVVEDSFTIDDIAVTPVYLRGR